ncbi:MAG: murein L,D-transpeptidase, partial [Psychrobacter alimentarius]
KNIPANKPVLVTYTITEDDIKTNFASTPAGAEAKSKMKGLYYQDIKEMFGERFHMDVRYLDKLNKNKTYKAGETITVL